MIMYIFVFNQILIISSHLNESDIKMYICILYIYMYFPATLVIHVYKEPSSLTSGGFSIVLVHTQMIISVACGKIQISMKSYLLSIAICVAKQGFYVR